MACRLGLAAYTHLGRLTLTIPTGTISRDLPQNLFFHFMSGVGWGRESDSRDKTRECSSPSPICPSPPAPSFTLPEYEVLRLRMAGRDGGVVGDLDEQGSSLEVAPEDPGVCS